jgi:hypothetical protein
MTDLLITALVAVAVIGLITYWASTWGPDDYRGRHRRDRIEEEIPADEGDEDGWPEELREPESDIPAVSTASGSAGAISSTNVRVMSGAAPAPYQRGDRTITVTGPQPWAPNLTSPVKIPDPTPMTRTPAAIQASGAAAKPRNLVGTSPARPLGTAEWAVLDQLAASAGIERERLADTGELRALAADGDPGWLERAYGKDWLA